MTPEQKAQFDKVQADFISCAIGLLDGTYRSVGSWMLDDFEKLKKMMGYYDETSGLNPDGSINWSGREKVFAGDVARGGEEMIWDGILWHRREKK